LEEEEEVGEGKRIKMRRGGGEVRVFVCVTFWDG